MPTNNLTHFILVDYENVPGIDLSPLGNHPICVTLFLGLKSKLKPELIEQITELPFEVRLIKIKGARKNLLDFVLTFHLGEMVSRYPRGHYYIVSGDKKDFDPVVAHFKSVHLHVSRHPDIASLPFLIQPKPVEPVKESPPAKPVVGAKLAVPVSKATVDRRAKIIAYLKNPTSNRPTTLKGLRAHIKNAFGKESATAKVEAVIQELSETGVISVNDKGNVTYR